MDVMLPLLAGNTRGLNRLSQVKLNLIINGFVFVIDNFNYASL